MSGTAHRAKSQDGSYRFGFWGDSRSCCWSVSGARQLPRRKKHHGYDDGGDDNAEQGSLGGHLCLAGNTNGWRGGLKFLATLFAFEFTHDIVLSG